MSINNFDINILAFTASESFGFNTDIFETNILNLSVVIGVLIYYGRITLGDLINDRKKSILKALEEAEKRFAEAKENLLVAQKNYESAKAKAEEIRAQSRSLSIQTSKNILESIEMDIKRLENSNLAAIRFEEEKSINELCQKLVSNSLLNASEKLNKRLNINIQKKITIQNINKLSVLKKK